MALDIEKICRTCLALNGPLLSIYDGRDNCGGTIADMLRNFTKMKPNISDDMPQKVCLACISEINRCYSFKMKCENSNRTLQQMLRLPDINNDSNSTLRSISIQTSPERQTTKQGICVQTSPKQDITNQSVSLPDTLTKSNQYKPKDLTINEVLNGSVQFPQSQNRKRNARELEREETDSSKENYKKKITERYNIDCDEDEGYDFILKLDANLEKELEAGNSINDENIIASSSNTVNNVASYNIAAENFECEEYEIEAYVEEDQIIESDEVVVVKAESHCSDENSQKNFVILKNFDRSKSDATSTKKEYGCTECVMSFYSLKVLRRHMSKLHGRNIDEIQINDMKYRVIDSKELYAEEQCNNVDTGALPIQEGEGEGVQEVTSNSELNKTARVKFNCGKCKSVFSSQRSLNYHKRKNICNAKSYECDQCERVFTSSDKLDSHKVTHKNAAIECAECGKSFTSTEELSNHLISVHKRNARNQCNICKKVFTMLSTLRDHLRTHSGEKPFLCTICGKSFTQSANLKQHIQRHDSNKKFKCDQCSNSFVTKAELYSHKRSHTGDHPFKCEECSATFTTSSSLVKHRRRHTGERPYSCDICPMRFAVLSVLKNHRRLHTGEKPFKCQYCEKRFTQRGDCMIHASKHAEVNEFICTCGKTFPHAVLLRQHSRRYHPELYEGGEAAATKKTSEDECNTSEENVEKMPRTQRNKAENIINSDLKTS